MTSSTRRLLVLAATTLSLAFSASGVDAAPALLSPSPTDTRVAGINVDRTTIPQLESLMDRQRLRAVQLVDFYLRRIKQLNPELHAVITVSSSALADARAADAARRRGSHLPLLGLPIMVKDNIDTTGMPTTAGSWALAGSSPPDAFIVARLRAAGALIIAKANLSEWANMRSAPSSSGWSGIGGQTNMAYVLDRNPCGSSSGSAVAASADLAVAAVGTETDGSIVCPSGANSDVGIKPTLGLLSRTGIVPISANQDTAGPIARSVTDAAVLLGVMTGIDRSDPATADQAGHAFNDYTRFLDAMALKGARIGVWRQETYSSRINPTVHRILKATVKALRAQGAIIVDPVPISIGAAYGPENRALLCEFKSDIKSYLGTYVEPSYPRKLLDVVHFDEAHRVKEGPWNSAIFSAAQATGGRADSRCTRARRRATSTARAAIDGTLAAHHLDAIIAPTNGPAWVTDPVYGDLGGNFSTYIASSSPSAIAGYPDITVPAGYVGHLPIGVSFMGDRWSEPRLIALAYAFEQATRVRVPPTFLPTESAPAGRGRHVARSHGWAFRALPATR